MTVARDPRPFVMTREALLSNLEARAELSERMQRQVVDWYGMGVTSGVISCKEACIQVIAEEFGEDDGLTSRLTALVDASSTGAVHG